LVTLNGVMAIILHDFTEIGTFWGQLCYSGRYLYPYSLQQKCSLKNVVLGSVIYGDTVRGY